jgi:Zn-dependent peptidase ImmA (M78 family)
LHRKRSIFLEGAVREGRSEKEADRFAADFLIPRAAFTRFANRRSFSKTGIRDFALEIGVSPGIVVGRLQHDGLLPFSHCNDLKMRLKWTRTARVAYHHDFLR